MKQIFFTTALLLSMAYASYTQQVYEADNGITASGAGTARKVSLGGALTGNTTIPFDGFNIHFTRLGNCCCAGRWGGWH